MSKDYYATLALPRNATSRQIKTRFLELARERHPDRFQGEEEKAKAEVEFQEITEAFNMLSDPERRRQLDLELARPTPGVGGASQQVSNQAARVYLRRGIKSYKERNYLDAAENFDRATREDPKDAQAWHYLALACSHQQRWRTRAATAAFKACELAPMEASYLKLAGRLAAEVGKTGRAEKYYTDALTWGGEDESVRSALEDLRQGRKRGKGNLFGRTG